MPSERESRLAENEVLFRDLNASIHGGGGRPVYEFVCECGDLHCYGRIPLTLAEYRAVRTDPHTFFVIADHDVADIEDVVRRTDRYWVVRKHDTVGEIVGA